MSNTFIDISGLTRPSDFETGDVTQNRPSTSATSLVLNIKNSQDANTLNIENYVIDFSGNNGVNSTTDTRTLVPSNKIANATNNDVTLIDLSANTIYDLSAHLINSQDMSNNKFNISGTTRPKNFIKSDISQNINATTSTNLVMKFHNSQVEGTLNINKFNVDVSGNNGANASKQNVNKVPSDKLPTATNNITFSDLSANTVYDLRTHMFNTQDLSSGNIDVSGVTRPTDFNNNGHDVSQNLTPSDISINQIVNRNIKVRFCWSFFCRCFGDSITISISTSSVFNSITTNI